ncbi:MarR family winged helix-turn-helix transcriptional regulator [Actinoplanes sp. NPDC023936]|uniref:MarR family winged helix-turn-helix transcriptional regulator n=1 Tax=Actinoplanes sp. NPDC023936 TaxID=3154910 RepID=UPI0033C2104C
MKARGQALFAFVRFWSRRWTGADPGAGAQRGREVMVVEAVHALSEQRRPTSVNDVARELGLDQSGVSRMVTHAERQGLVVRRASGRIGAASAITNTAAGEELLRQAHAWQDEVLRTLTADWPDEDVETLMVLMDRLVRAQNATGADGH